MKTSIDLNILMHIFILLPENSLEGGLRFIAYCYTVLHVSR